MALWVKGSIPWNKNIPTKVKRCKKCGQMIGNNLIHNCVNVDGRKLRKCCYCGRGLDNEHGRCGSGWGERYQKYCRKCGMKHSNSFEFITRQKLVKEFGGKCQICGFKENTCALDFHHIDPETKKRKHYMGQIKNRPDQFCLICSNHHRMITYNIISCPKSSFKKGQDLKSVKVSHEEVFALMNKRYKFS